MARLFPALLLAILLTAAVPLAQQTPVLRSGTHTVSVYASVVDRTGHLVTGLTRDGETSVEMEAAVDVDRLPRHVVRHLRREEQRS